MTLNQQYKASKSTLPFKEWLFQQQCAGKLDFNAVGPNPENKTSVSIFGINAKVLVIGALALLTVAIIVKSNNA